MKDYNFIDPSYANVSISGDAVVHEIKTRRGSFAKITGAWNKARAMFLGNESETSKDSVASNENETMENKSTENKIENKSNIIAKIEKTITIKSRESVPSNYYSMRAIKLKNSMITNLVKNCDSAYAYIDANKENQVITSDEVEKTDDKNSTVDISTIAPIANIEVPSVAEETEEASAVAPSDSVVEEVNTNENIESQSAVETEAETDVETAEAAPVEQNSEEVNVVPTSYESDLIKDSITSSFTEPVDYSSDDAPMFQLISDEQPENTEVREESKIKVPSSDASIINNIIKYNRPDLPQFNTFDWKVLIDTAKSNVGSVMPGSSFSGKVTHDVPIVVPERTDGNVSAKVMQETPNVVSVKFDAQAISRMKAAIDAQKARIAENTQTADIIRERQAAADSALTEARQHDDDINNRYQEQMERLQAYLTNLSLCADSKELENLEGANTLQEKEKQINQLRQESSEKEAALNEIYNMLSEQPSDLVTEGSYSVGRR